MLAILILIAFVNYWQGGRALHLQNNMRDLSYKLLNDSKKFSQSMHNVHALMLRYKEQNDNESELIGLGLSVIRNIVQTGHIKGDLRQKETTLLNKHVSQIGNLAQLYIDEERQYPGGDDALQLRSLLENELSDLQILVLELKRKNTSAIKQQILDLLQDIDNALYEYAEKEYITADVVDVLLSHAESSLGNLNALVKNSLVRIDGNEFNNKIQSYFSQYSQQSKKYFSIARIILYANEDAGFTQDDLDNVNDAFTSQWYDLNLQKKQIRELLINRLQTEIDGTINFLKYSQRVSLLAAIIGLILVVAAMIILNRLLRKRLGILFKGAVQYTDGNLEEKIILNSRDGFSSLADQFNLMSEQILLRENQLVNINATLEKRIHERTQELENSLEAAESANRAKSEFLSQMSHELRTPMNAILGFGQVLNMNADELNEVQQGNVKEILKAGNHLLNLINELLDLARIESGKLDISMGNVIVDEVIQQSISLITPQLASCHIELTDHISGKGFIVQADFIRLKQVLVNLLSNAVKYNCENGHIILDSELVDKQRLRIRVTDSGEGLTKEEIDKLFTPFERLNKKNNIEGAGIGLVITKHLVELMDGAIGVESTPGKCCTFWVEFTLMK